MKANAEAKSEENIPAAQSPSPLSEEHTKEQKNRTTSPASVETKKRSTKPLQAATPASAFPERVSRARLISTSIAISCVAITALIIFSLATSSRGNLQRHSSKLANCDPAVVGDQVIQSLNILANSTINIWNYVTMPNKKYFAQHFQATDHRNISLFGANFKFSDITMNVTLHYGLLQAKFLYKDALFLIMDFKNLVISVAVHTTQRLLKAHSAQVIAVETQKLIVSNDQALNYISVTDKYDAPGTLNQALQGIFPAYVTTALTARSKAILKELPCIQ